LVAGLCTVGSSVDWMLSGALNCVTDPVL